VGDPEKLEGMRRLDGFVRAVERQGEVVADFAGIMAHERRISPALGGRTVFDDRRKKSSAQLPLFG
jgi:uncharacterized protein